MSERSIPVKFKHCLCLTIWQNVDDMAATVDVEMLRPFAANVDNNVEC